MLLFRVVFYSFHMNHFNLLIKDLEMFIETLNNINYSCEKDLFKKEMEKFWEYIQNYTNKEVTEQFLKSDSLPLFQKEFKKFEEYYERLIEVEDAMIINADILKDKKESVLSFIKNGFVIDNYKMVSKEIQMIEKKNPQKLVMIGCGSLPETILFIADNTDIPDIIGIDCNQEAIAIAGDIIKALGHEDRIRLVCSYGEEYDFSDADIIHIANATRDKNAVFQQISKTAKKGTDIIVRNPTYLAKMMYTSLKEVPKNIVFRKEEIGDTKFLHNPFLYKKV